MSRININRKELKDLLKVYKSQKELSKKLGVSPSTVSRAIRGKTRYFQKEKTDKRIESLLDKNFYYQGSIKYKDVSGTKIYTRTNLARTQKGAERLIIEKIDFLKQSANRRKGKIRILNIEIIRYIKRK